MTVDYFLERPVSRVNSTSRTVYRVEIQLWFKRTGTEDSGFSEKKQIWLKKKKGEQRKLSISMFIYKLGKYESCATILRNNGQLSWLLFYPILFFFHTVVEL